MAFYKTGISPIIASAEQIEMFDTKEETKSDSDKEAVVEKKEEEISN